ncbi:MAG: hypothetical protein LUG12_00015 [Erysipelotrichaceae bacterium]|nr:hypothetical protein [Erysipelotrichaceae bacterium]
MKTTKKNIVTKSLAIGLAAVLLVGLGSYSYLTSKTENVTNTFATNKVLVNIEEESGSNYNIVPGTSETKNPRVTVDNSEDAYVYLIVTDNTQGLVDYTIDEGWTVLEGYSNVYYREVSADAENKEFTVLTNDTVSYSSSLTNADMLDEDGNLKEGIELTFSALAIQKIKSNNETWSAADAYFYLMDGYVNDDINNQEDFETAISNAYFNITLTDNVPENQSNTQTYSARSYEVTIAATNGTINASNYVLATHLDITSGTLTINGDYTGFTSSNATVTGTYASAGLINVTNNGTVLNINGGRYQQNGRSGSIVKANTGTTVNINGGYYKITGLEGFVFEADGGTIYVNNYDYVNLNGRKTTTYKATNGGTIYVAATIYTDSISSDSQVSDSTVTINGTEYYVITEA